MSQHSETGQQRTHRVTVHDASYFCLVGARRWGNSAHAALGALHPLQQQWRHLWQRATACVLQSATNSFAAVCRLTTTSQQPSTSAHHVRMPMPRAVGLNLRSWPAWPLDQHSAGVKRHEASAEEKTLRVLWVTLKKLEENIQKKLHYKYYTTAGGRLS